MEGDRRQILKKVLLSSDQVKKKLQSEVGCAKCDIVREDLMISKNCEHFLCKECLDIGE